MDEYTKNWILGIIGYLAGGHLLCSYIAVSILPFDPLTSSGQLSLFVMPFNSPTDFAAAISGTETALGVHYPAVAPQLLADLSTIVGSPKHYGLFERARLLVKATDVCEPRDELGGRLIDGNLLPFLSDEQGQWPDIYGFDMADPKLDRVAVFSVHTIVHDWANADVFLRWVRNFVPPKPSQ